MKIKQKIGVVGNGFVGGAVRYGFSPNVGCDAEVRTYDKDPNKSTHSLEETINESDFNNQPKVETGMKVGIKIQFDGDPASTIDYYITSVWRVEVEI